MEMPSFLMSKTVLAGAGAVGTAAAGTITVQVSRGPYSLDPNKLSKFRWTFNTDPQLQNLDLIGGDCVQNLFPSFAYPTLQQMANPRSSQSSITKPSFPAGGKSNLTGCKLIKFTKSSDGKTFVYKSEIAARNGDEGLVLSSAIAKTATSNSTDHKFWLLYLKKDKDLWKMDWEHEFKKHSGDNFSITTPFGFALPRVNQQFSMVDASADSSGKNFHGTWIWERSNDGDSPLFYESSHNKRPNTERDWFMEKNAAALHVYSNLKNLKGTWKKSQDYCNAFGASQFKSPDQIPELVRDLCYVRNY